MSRRQRDWSTLPDNLLLTIVGLLQMRVDYIRLRAVCKSFRSAIPLPNACSPHLDLYFDYDYQFLPKTRQLVIRQYTIYAIEAISQNPNCTSYAQNGAKAWFVKVKESNSGKVRLLEPFESLDFKNIYDVLPKSLSLFDYRVTEIAKEYSLECVDDLYPFKCPHQKVAVSSDSGDELVLMTLIVSEVSMWRSGTKEWIRFAFHYRYPTDVIYHNKKFYVLMSNGRAVSVDPETLECSVAVRPVPKKTGGDKSFVRSGHNLFMVVKYRLFNENKYGRDWIDIFKLDEEKQKWNQMKDGLGDRALFMFQGSNFFVSAKDFNVCKPNCVYFSDRGREVDNDYPGKDAKLFSLEDGTIKCLSALPGYSEIFWPPPSWLVPKCASSPSYTSLASDVSSLLHQILTNQSTILARLDRIEGILAVPPPSDDPASDA